MGGTYPEAVLSPVNSAEPVAEGSRRCYRLSVAERAQLCEPNTCETYHWPWLLRVAPTPMSR